MGLTHRAIIMRRQEDGSLFVNDIFERALPPDKLLRFVKRELACGLTDAQVGERIVIQLSEVGKDALIRQVEWTVPQEYHG